MRAAGLLALLLGWSLLGGCTAWRPGMPPPTLYALERAPAAELRQAAAGMAALARPDGAPTLVVGLPRAAAGYDSPRMIYLRQPYELEYFSRSLWVDTPARMLQPLIAAAVERTGKFGAVVQMPVSARGDFRLETELVRLQQEFMQRPSRVHVTLRATLVDPATRRVIAWREFDGAAPAASDDPYGGVVAANQAVRELLDELAAFCVAALVNTDNRPEPAGRPGAMPSAPATVPRPD